MKILRTRAASVSRQGLCTALLVASLTAAVGVSPPHPTANSEDPAPGPGNPQTLPHGSPNLALPDLVPPPGTGKPGPGGPGSKEEVKGIPATALAAYKNAERYAKEQWPDCHVPWELIAAIGKVESEHGAMGGGLRPDGSTEKPIIGPRLTGEKFALVRDTDGGRWDGDTQYDHAIGPMQFIPSTWASYSADGRNAGQKDPNNIFDAAAGTARYLCAGGLDLRKQADLEKAVLRYNSSREYLNSVVAWMNAYRNGEGGAIPDPSSGSSPYPGTTPRPTRPVPTGPVPTGPGTTPPSTTTPERPDGSKKPGDQGRSKDQDKSRDRGKPDKDKPEHKKPTPKPVPSAQVTRLESDSSKELTATVGKTFEPAPRVRAVTADGKDAPEGTRIRFDIVGEGPKFKKGGRTDFANVGKGGKATASVISAGQQTGVFYVRATVVGRDLPAVEFKATVTAPQAQRFEQVNGPLKVAAGGYTEEGAVAKAYDADGKAVDGVTVVITVGGDDKEGPYFKEKGKQAHTVTTVTKDGGRVYLPKLFGGNKEGAFTLILTTDNKAAKATLDLTVTPKKGKDEPGDSTGKGQPSNKPTAPGQPDKSPKPKATSAR